MVTDEHIRTNCRNLVRTVVLRRTAWAAVMMLVGAAFSPISVQSKGQVRQKTGETLEWLLRTLKDGLRSGPPPDILAIKKTFCELFPEQCSYFPKEPRNVYKFGGLYSFPGPSASAIFFNKKQKDVMVLPPRVLDGVMMTVLHLKQQGWNSERIAAWLLPVSSHHYSRMEAKGDCYIYRSESGCVIIQFEGIASSGDRLRVRLFSENFSKNEQRSHKDLRLRVPSALHSYPPCSRFDEFEAYWEKLFNL